MSFNILICGIGGQGTVLAAKLLDQAALISGLAVHSAETIGMAQRGGSVISHVRIGENCHSPLIPHGTADMIIAFEITEAVRNIRYLKKGGAVIVNKKLVLPAEARKMQNIPDEDSMLDFLKKNSGHISVIDSEKICSELKSSKITNTIMLGAALAYGITGITEDSLKEAVRTTVKPAFAELNICALEKGFGGKK